MARRLAIIACALAGAACFLLAVQGGRWWTIGDASIGPISTERCYGGHCGPGGLGWAGGSDTWIRSGFMTYVAGMCAAAVLVALAGAVAAGRTGRLAAAVALVANLTAIVVGAVFVLSRPELPATVGRGVWLYGAAVVSAAIAVVVTLVRRPRE